MENDGQLTRSRVSRVQPYGKSVVRSEVPDGGGVGKPRPLRRVVEGNRVPNRSESLVLRARFEVLDAHCPGARAHRSPTGVAVHGVELRAVVGRTVVELAPGRGPRRGGR